ncbi:hypothetical protein JD844_013093 [Phrynosoma platyrhinos]|uniref:Uncharacterized protein n=1 Tax=Phrynosoma platyrhinos TaxID=52577 RepID=A0ABQ7TLC5_PHRPL|nr:hypothetical protein JD844_013093 [Phrynosoma platyrhinos]
MPPPQSSSDALLTASILDLMLTAPHIPLSLSHMAVFYDMESGGDNAEYCDLTILHKFYSMIQREKEKLNSLLKLQFCIDLTSS